MTKDDIVLMAREAGFEGMTDHPALMRFANLVAAHEREACAEVCEDASGTGQIISCKSAADAIRARGTP